jgi:hypothetical protein
VIITMLVAALVILGVVYRRSRREYDEYAQNYWENSMRDCQRIHEETGLWVTPGLSISYYSWNNGGMILTVGHLLMLALVATVVLSIFSIRRSLGKR